VTVPPARRRTPAEEARTLVAGNRMAALSTLSEDGSPWASLVLYGTLEDGTPVLCLSTLAEHGRNVARDPRASLLVGEADVAGDPLDSGRVTLAGRLETPAGDQLDAARAAYTAAAPASGLYGGFGDFTYSVLRIERVRWVGGYGRMDSTDAEAFHAAAPDPVASGAASAIEHLNADHADALLSMARRLAGHADATAAGCVRIDRYGMDLHVQTPRGLTETRVAFAAPANRPGDLRAATVELAKRARAT
jgi:putative heme iron utilization protein